MNFNDYLDLYGSSFSLIIIPFVAFLLFLLSDEPPPIPPDSVTGIIDCQNVFALNMSTNNSRIKMTVSLGKFVEYPIETALELMRVVARTGDLTSEYPTSTFWDVEVDGPNLTLAILHGISGTVNVVLLCHTHPLSEMIATVTGLDIYPPGYTRS
jgi:hypothetical protein